MRGIGSYPENLDKWADDKAAAFLRQASGTIGAAHVACEHAVDFRDSLPTVGEIRAMGLWAGYDTVASMTGAHSAAAIACQITMELASVQ